MIRLGALTGIVLISLSAIFVRLAEVSPATAAFFRTGYALPVLAVLAALVRKRDRRSAAARRLAFASGLFLAADLVLWHRAIELIGAGLATILANTQVVFVAMGAWLLHRERPTLAALVTLPAIFGGVALISGVGQALHEGTGSIAGAAYGVLAAVAYAAFLMAFRVSNKTAAPAAGPLFDATLGAAAGSLLWGLVDGSLQFELSGAAHGWLLALALLPHALGWLLISVALPRLPALGTSVLLLLQPMLTVLWAMLLFGEALTPWQWLGAAIVLAGVGWLSWRGGAEHEPQPASSS